VTLQLQKSDVDARSERDRTYFKSGEATAEELAQAVIYYREAAEQGFSNAQEILAKMYDEGWGVPQDMAQAAMWYRKAAEQGHVVAQYILAWMYDNGEGIAEDKAQAVDWYRKAAEQGDAAAQYNLARMYDNGEGVPRNTIHAANWYAQAAAQGDADARARLDKMAEDGVPMFPVDPQKLNALIDTLSLCLPQFDPTPLRVDLSVAPDDLLDWMSEHLDEQGLHSYWEWKAYWGELPELRPLDDLDLSAFNEDFVWGVVESLDGFEAIGWPSNIPFVAYINSFLIPHGLRLIELGPFANAHILCVKNDPAALEQLDLALKAFNMTFFPHEALDEAGVRGHIEELMAKE
jgi:hypothetical protein